MTRRTETPNSLYREGECYRISTHTDLESREQNNRYKVTKPIRRFRVAKYTPRKSTSLFISCNKQPNQQDGNTSKLAKVRLLPFWISYKPFWTAAQASVKARRTDATIAPIPPCGGIPVCIVLKAGASPARPKQSYNGKPRSPYGFGERGLSWYLQSGKINIFAGQLFFALQVDRANALESRAYRKF